MQAALPGYELGLSDSETDALSRDAVVWANQHGLVRGLAAHAALHAAPPMHCPTSPLCPLQVVALQGEGFVNPEVAVIHAPITCLPVAFPRDRFLQAKAVMPVFSAMVDRVASDEAYLETTLSQAARFDEFTGRLLSLLKASRQARQALGERNISLGVHRSDYMLDAPSGGFLQVRPVAGVCVCVCVR